MLTQVDRGQVKRELDDFDLDIRLAPTVTAARQLDIRASGSCGNSCTCQFTCQNTCGGTCSPPSCGGTCDPSVCQCPTDGCSGIFCF